MQVPPSKVFAVAALLILAACAAPGPRAQASPLSYHPGGSDLLEVLIDGAPAPQFFHAGESYVLGRHGARYTLRVWNRTYGRVEAVVSVDGLDVVDGKPADYREKRGYVIAPGGFVDIDGWRLSGLQAAAFRFGSVRDSYAARTSGARNVGVIGVALFPERPAPVAWPVYPHPVPRPFPRPPRFYRWQPESAPGAASAPAPAAPAVESNRSPAASESNRPADVTVDKSSAPRGEFAGGATARVPAHRLGLGTEFGEAVDSAVEQVSFVRADRTNPATLLAVRYNDRAGLLAIGIDVDADAWQNERLSEERLRRSADPFPAAEHAYASPPPGWRR